MMSPPPFLVPLKVTASRHVAADYADVGVEGKAGSLVDDSGHFYKPLQVRIRPITACSVLLHPCACAQVGGTRRQIVVPEIGAP